MTREAKPLQKSFIPEILLACIFFIPYILIKIGDVVIFFCKICLITWKLLLRNGRKLFPIISRLGSHVKRHIDRAWKHSHTSVVSTTDAWGRQTVKTSQIIFQYTLSSSQIIRQWGQTLLGQFHRRKKVKKTIHKKNTLKKHQTKTTVIAKPRLSVLMTLLAFATGSLATMLFIFIPFTTYQWLRTLPNPYLLSRRDVDVTSKIFDKNGVLLYEIYADQNRTPLPLKDIPLIIRQATIAIEDRDFYHHQGFSIKGMLRAANETILRKQIQGGSTITQQLVKSSLLSPEIKLSRKIKELILAFWAERIYTKDQILEMYLNQVPYGGTAWGLEAASQTYFGKSIRDISLAEAALLAGLPAAPTDYSPFGSQPQKAYERQREVLRRMTEDGYISKDQADQAAQQVLTFATPRIPIRAPHFVLYVKELLERRYGPRLVQRGGLRIITSLDERVQDKVEEIVKNQITSLAKLRVGNGGALVTNPRTGEIIAMVGSKDYFNLTEDGNVNVTTSLRQPGSSIKVVTYTAALENGMTAATLLDDSPIVYQIPGSTAYTPVNYDGRFHGLTPMRYALGNSYNIPAVKAIQKIGVTAMVEKGKLMGITSSWDDDSRFGLSLTLGAGEVTMMEMAQVFGTLANNGTRVDLTPILEVTDYTGRVIERQRPKIGIQAVKPEVAWIMSNILSDNIARTAAFGPNSALVIPGKTVSVKTGTSNEKRDNWTIGYTPSYVTTVWVGNNNNAPMDPYLTSGITGAAPIWNAIMTEVLKDKADEGMPKPDTVIGVPCYFGRTEFFIKGTEPINGQCAPMPTPTGSPTPSPKQTLDIPDTAPLAMKRKSPGQKHIH